LWKEAGDASYLSETTSKTRRPASPDLTVGLEAIYHHIPLSLILPAVTEELFLIRIILITSYSLQRIFMHYRNTQRRLQCFGPEEESEPWPDRPVLCRFSYLDFGEFTFYEVG
jgi:hypothetical protein